MGNIQLFQLPKCEYLVVRISLGFKLLKSVIKKICKLFGYEVCDNPKCKQGKTSSEHYFLAYTELITVENCKVI